MPKRPGGRWDVDPGYELPVTRLKARDKAIALPRVQDVPLPPRRKRCVRLSAPAAVPALAAVPAPAAVPPPENSGNMTIENQTENSENENQIGETMTGNQIEEMIIENQGENTQENQIAPKVSRNQTEESVSQNPTEVKVALDQMEDKNPQRIPEDQTENSETENQLDETMTGNQIEEMIIENQGESTQENQIAPKVSRNQTEERVPQIPTEVDVPLDQIEEKTSGDQSVTLTPGGQKEKAINEQLIKQRDTTNQIDSAANLDNSETLDNADVVGIVENMDSQDTVDNLDAVMRSMTINNLKIHTPNMVDKTTTMDMPVMVQRETMMDTPLMVDKETHTDQPALAESGSMGNQTDALNQDTACPAADNPAQHPQRAISPSKMNAQPPLRLGGPGDETPKRNPLIRPALLPTPKSPVKQRLLPFLVTEPPKQKADILTERKFIFNPDFKGLTEVQTKDQNQPKGQFSVVSYNIRAEMEKEAGTRREKETAGYSVGDRRGTGKGGGREVCKGAENSETPSILLPNNYMIRLIKELHFLDAEIVCLQSVEECFWVRLEKILYNHGYSGFRQNRRYGSNTFAEAIFFKFTRFELVKCHGFFLDDLIVKQSLQPGVIYHCGIRDSVDSREVASVVVLRCKQTGHHFRVANIRCVPEHKHRPDLQAAQVCSILQEIGGMDNDPNKRLPFLLCGDFDFQPHEGPYQILQDRSINSSTLQTFNGIGSVTVSSGQKAPLTAVYRGGFQHPFTALRSAYATVLGTEPPSVWKRESDSFVCGSYVWFDEVKLSVVGVLGMVASKVITGPGIPNEEFPSGSLSLKAVFNFCKRQ